MNGRTDLALEKGLPANLDAERFVLGAALIGQPFANITAVLQDTDFSLEKHRRIFAAMVHLDSTGVAIDRVTVANELQRRGQLESVDGVGYLCSLDEGLPEVVNLDAYVSIVHDRSLQRQAIFALSAAIDEFFLAADPTPEILERSERILGAIATKTRSVSLRTPKEVIDRAGGLTAIVNPPKTSCIETPWPLLNGMLMSGGFTPGQMVTIGARPSIGKTALACQIADSAAASTGVAFFTLEMPDQSILLRMAAARAQVDSLKVTQRRATPSEIQALTGAFNDLANEKNCRLWIDDTTGCTVPAMRASLRRLTAGHSIGLVVIDYLQLVEISGGSGRNRYEQVSEISRGVKRLAREFKVPVVVLAQLNRESEKEKRQPRLSDLRDSGSIEQDADVILLPALHGEQDEHADELAIDLIIAKQRNGPRGIVPLKFLRRYAKFVELAAKRETEVA